MDLAAAMMEQTFKQMEKAQKDEEIAFLQNSDCEEKDNSEMAI